MLPPYDLGKIYDLSDEIILDAIRNCRTVLRYVRNQTGDERCFLDYWLIWKMLPDSPPVPRFSAEEGMEHCRLFSANCRADTVDEANPKAACNPRRLDSNLPNMQRDELVTELQLLQKAFIRHRDIEKIEKRPRTIDDDRELFRVTLPEQVACDFRLPPPKEFLENPDGRKGCTSFWKSHESCGASCNLHLWGPCNAAGAARQK